MLNADFYKILDTQIEEILATYHKEDAYFQKHSKNPNNQKSYGLLIWFLRKYARLPNYLDYITDGENDGSCDIIFSRINNQKETVFYVVQSKWNNLSNASKPTSRDEIKKALNDFNTVLNGHKTNLNSKTDDWIKKLSEHRSKNGRVQFIFLSLDNYQQDAADSLRAFAAQDPNWSVDILDLNRLKTDFIDTEYKKIRLTNLLDTYPDPTKSKLFLKVERLQNSQSTFLDVQAPFKSYIFLIRPKTVFEWFDKYSFALFFKNVRNPLLESDFNRTIQQTASKNPALFWYYNNGITAICRVIPTISPVATEIEVTGFQIINGAQTVFAVYQAYKEADPDTREELDQNMLLTLRLVQSGGADFDLNITRYTNAQNPVEASDFIVNDEVQARLQRESFETPFWYKIRKGEFRTMPKEVQILDKEDLAYAYMRYEFEIYGDDYAEIADWIFISNKQSDRGLYERYFNKDTNFEKMLSAYLVDRLVDKFSVSNYFYKYVAEKYFVLKFQLKPEKVYAKIIECALDKTKLPILLKIGLFITNKRFKFLTGIGKDVFKNDLHLETAETIDSIVLSDDLVEKIQGIKTNFLELDDDLPF